MVKETINLVVLINLKMGHRPCLLMPILRSEISDIEEIKKRSKMMRAKAREKRVEKIKNG